MILKIKNFRNSGFPECWILSLNCSLTMLSVYPPGPTHFAQPILLLLTPFSFQRFVQFSRADLDKKRTGGNPKFTSTFFVSRRKRTARYGSIYLRIISIFPAFLHSLRFITIVIFIGYYCYIFTVIFSTVIHHYCNISLHNLFFLDFCML